jgi:hypothetical protein
MVAMGLDLAHEKNHPGGRAGGLAESAFASLFAGWRLITFGCLHLAVPAGTPLVTGATLSEVVGGIRGAAVRDRCPNGTGWPLLRTSR